MCCVLGFFFGKDGKNSLARYYRCNVFDVYIVVVTQLNKLLDLSISLYIVVSSLCVRY